MLKKTFAWLFVMVFSLFSALCEATGLRKIFNSHLNDQFHIEDCWGTYEPYSYDRSGSYWGAHQQYYDRYMSYYYPSNLSRGGGSTSRGGRGGCNTRYPTYPSSRGGYRK